MLAVERRILVPVGFVSVERQMRAAIQVKLAALVLASAELHRLVLDYQREPTAMHLITFVNAQQLCLRAQLERSVLVELALVSIACSLYSIDVL